MPSPLPVAPPPEEPIEPPRRSARGIALRLAVAAALVVALLMLAPVDRLFFVPTAGPTPVEEGPPGTRLLRFPSEDGTVLAAWFVPAQPPAEEVAVAPGPAVLHLHGNAGNILSHAWFTEALPPAGFHVMILDYRGYGESEGSPSRREDLLADARAALGALAAQPEVDPARIGIYGQSLGGAIAVALAAESPEVRGLVLESPFEGWRRAAANALGGDPPGVLARLIAAALVRDHLAPRELIAKVRAPILLLHGDADRIVPPSHSRGLRDAAAGEVEWVELEGGEHNDLRRSHPEVDRRMIEFLRRSLGEVSD